MTYWCICKAGPSQLSVKDLIGFAWRMPKNLEAGMFSGSQPNSSTPLIFRLISHAYPAFSKKQTRLS